MGVTKDRPIRFQVLQMYGTESSRCVYNQGTPGISIFTQPPVAFEIFERLKKEYGFKRR